jgi:hypothetical protein
MTWNVIAAAMKRHLSDIIFIAVVFLVVLLTTSLPYYLQVRHAPAGEHFGGIIFAVTDQNSYLMWMRQAAEGHVLWRDLMTTDPHQPFYTNLLWLALGRLAGQPGNLLIVYHAARVLLSLLLLIAVYALLGTVFGRRGAGKGPWERRAALLLLATGDGLFWMFFQFHQLGPAGVAPGTEAFWAPELLAWPSMALLPHFVAGMAAMAGVFYLALAAYQRPACWGWYAAAGGLLLAVLAGFHVYDVVTVGAVLVVHAIVTQRAGKAPPQLARALAVILAPGVVATLLVEMMLSRSPIGRAWEHSNQMYSWSPLTYAVGLGFPLLVALADHKRLFHWREMSVAEILPAVWLLVNIPLVFTDGIIPFERRLVMGIQIPVVMLAVANWGKYVAPRLERTPVIAWTLLLMMGWPGLLLRMNYLATHADYVSNDFLAAAQALGALPPGQGVLCRGPLGTWLPQLTGQAVYVGHNELSPDAPERQEEVREFFDAATTDQARRALLVKAHCNYVLAEGQERAALTGAWLVPVERRGEVTLYRVGGSTVP